MFCMILPWCDIEVYTSLAKKFMPMLGPQNSILEEPIFWFLLLGFQNNNLISLKKLKSSVLGYLLFKVKSSKFMGKTGGQHLPGKPLVLMHTQVWTNVIRSVVGVGGGGQRPHTPFDRVDASTQYFCPQNPCETYMTYVALILSAYSLT